MLDAKEKFIVDHDGNRVGVLLDIKDYEKIMEELEELDEIKAYKRAKSSKGEVLPFRKAVEEIESEMT